MRSWTSGSRWRGREGEDISASSSSPSTGSTGEEVSLHFRKFLSTIYWQCGT